jgi:hypothetical protein
MSDTHETWLLVRSTSTQITEVTAAEFHVELPFHVGLK